MGLVYEPLVPPSRRASPAELLDPYEYSNPSRRRWPPRSRAWTSIRIWATAASPGGILGAWTEYLDNNRRRHAQPSPGSRMGTIQPVSAAAKCLRDAPKQTVEPEIQACVKAPFDAIGAVYPVFEKPGAKKRGEAYWQDGIEITLTVVESMIELSKPRWPTRPRAGPR